MNNVVLYGKKCSESFSNVGDNWLRILFNLQYRFSLDKPNEIIRYLNNVDMDYKNWELDNVGGDYCAVLLRGKDLDNNIKYMLLTKEK